MKRRAATPSLTDRLATLAEPIRLRVLRLLELEELSVGEIARVVQLPQSTVSRHLKLLADGGWLVRRAVATATLYKLVLDDLPMDARKLWLAVREQMADRDAEDDRRRLAAVLADRRTDSQSFFGRVAGEWDELRGWLFGRHFTAEGLLAMLSPRWVVADLGCGTGNASEVLAPFVAGVVAVDQSEPMLEAARKRLAGVPNVSFRSGRLEALPLADASVDAAVCTLVLHHLPDPLPAVREMRRVLRGTNGGGVAVVIDMFEHDRVDYRHTMGHQHPGFSPTAMSRLFSDAGLRPRGVVPLRSDPEAKGPGLFVATAGIEDGRLELAGGAGEQSGAEAGGRVD